MLFRLNGRNGGTRPRKQKPNKVYRNNKIPEWILAVAEPEPEAEELRLQAQQLHPDPSHIFGLMKGG